MCHGSSNPVEQVMGMARPLPPRYVAAAGIRKRIRASSRGRSRLAARLPDQAGRTTWDARIARRHLVGSASERRLPNLPDGRGNRLRYRSDTRTALQVGTQRVNGPPMTDNADGQQPRRTPRVWSAAVRTGAEARRSDAGPDPFHPVC